MATYSNQHWLLSHIRNSFISTDETSMCETVMISDDLPKHYLRKFQHPTIIGNQQPKKYLIVNSTSKGQRNLDPPLQEIDMVCYPGVDESDDEDIDLSSQSFDIQMYPEVGAHRFRSYTAQKLEKMDIARRKAARTKCVNFDDEVMTSERSDLFVRKPINKLSTKELRTTKTGEDILEETNFKSKLAMQLENSPKQTQNRFIEYARFDGTSQGGMQTKRINVYLSMLPEKERNYPMKICVVATAKIIEVIGLVCYKATIQYPDIPLKSIRHYALYMTEDNDEMEDFPPLDNREPCSKFGFSHLTLAERRPLVSVTRVDYQNNLATKSMTSEEDKARLAAAAVRSLQNIDLNGGNDESEANDPSIGNGDDYEERMLSHNDMVEAPIYRTYRLQIIDKRFFKTDVSLGISGERIEIDQHKNAKFWTKQKAVTYPINSVAFCEIVEERHLKATVRIWVRSSSSSSSTSSGLIDGKMSAIGAQSSSSGAHSPNSPSHYAQVTSPFAFLLHSGHTLSGQNNTRFKHYDFEADMHTAEQVRSKLNYILEMRFSEARREYLQLRERKREKNQIKKLSKT